MPEYLYTLNSLRRELVQKYIPYAAMRPSGVPVQTTQREISWHSIFSRSYKTLRLSTVGLFHQQTSTNLYRNTTLALDSHTYSGLTVLSSLLEGFHTNQPHGYNTSFSYRQTTGPEPKKSTLHEILVI